MNVGQPVIMQAANSEAQEPTEDVMDDADVAGLAIILCILNSFHYTSSLILKKYCISLLFFL